MADMSASRRLLEDTIFSPSINVDLLFAILDRPNCDTDVDHVRLVCMQIADGTLTTLTLDGLRGMIKDTQAASLKFFLNKDKHAAGAGIANLYRVVTEEEQQMKMMDMASSGVFPAIAPRLQKMLDEAQEQEAVLLKEAVEEEEDWVDEDAAPSTLSAEALFEEEQQKDLPWIPRHALPPLEGYHWFYTIFYRVNGSFKLHQAYLRMNPKDRFLAHKIWRFQEAHLRIIQYLDGLEDPSDAAIDEAHLVSLYRRLGESHYNCDTSFITVTRTEHKVKPTPLEIICDAYPDDWWRPEEIAVRIRDGSFDVECLTHLVDGEWDPIGRESAPNHRTHSLYYGVVYVINMAREYMSSDPPPPSDEVRDALWAYYVSFLELFYFCIPRQRMDDVFLLTPLDSEIGRDGKWIFSDKPSPWGLYGTMDTRAFVAGDLPDFYNALVAIPLWGEQHTPAYYIGKIYQKSLPFACQRRHIIKLIVKCIDNHPGFWRIFSKLCWVMLANLYPGELACKSANLIMRDLMRIKELTDSKELLIAAITANQLGFNGVTKKVEGSNGGPLVVFTVFRLHILYMASFNDQYVEHARRCIDWDYFKKDVLKLADVVRTQSLFADDPFARARMQLSKTVKSPHSKVHRLRRRSMAICLMDQMNETLEKTILKDRQNFSNDLTKLTAIMPLMASSSSIATPRTPRLLLSSASECNNTLSAAAAATQALVGTVDESIKMKFKDTVLGAHLYSAQKEACFASLESFSQLLEASIEVAKDAIYFYKRLLEVKYKAPLLNLLIRMEPHERMTHKAFSILTLPEYGGVSEECISLLCDLVRIYHQKAVPKEFKQRIDRLSMPHFMVACYYFNMVATLEKINFIPLDAETTRRTDLAIMTRRHHLFPGQEVPDSVYNVSVALCCEKICTLMGFGKNGDKRVAYDIEKQAFVCAHGKSLKKKGSSPSGGEEDDDDKKKKGGEGAESDDEDEEAPDQAAILLEAQNDADLDFDLETLSSVAIATNLTSDAATMKGKGTKRSLVMQERKAVRNERKTFSKVPCGQPVLTFSLRGRALIWGNTLENKTQVMFCPTCGALHVYSMLNFCESETGDYRCNECARKEVMHLEYRKCAYCQRSSVGPPKEDTRLEVLCPTTDPSDPSFDPLANPEGVLQALYFCRAHYNIAKMFVCSRGGVTKQDLWKLIKIKQDQNNMQHARGIHKK